MTVELLGSSCISHYNEELKLIAKMMPIIGDSC